jgi:hypothetical protein
MSKWEKPYPKAEFECFVKSSLKQVETTMFRKSANRLIIVATILGASIANAKASEVACMAIGGVAIPNFFAEREGKRGGL